MNQVAEGPNIEEIEENIPDDDKDPEEIEAHEPFCLKDHLEIEEFNEINEEKCHLFVFFEFFDDFWDLANFFLNGV